MYGKFKEQITGQLNELRAQGLFKAERIITTPQSARVQVSGGTPVLNMCANNYLGLASHPAILEAAREGLEKWGYGMASVRFICGTQAPHRELERKLSEFLGTEETILYSSCFDANGGLFETLLGAEDAIISDELNHASIIDGVRLCKAQRYRYKNNDMADLETQLRAAKSARFRMIATDGVFSMDGYIANLPAICDLAEKYDALVMVDDSHAAGFMGKHGRGTHEYHNVMGRVDIITGTLGKALGGASGGYTSGRAEIIGYLRQRSRPYLFSNTLAPSVVAGSLKALELIGGSTAIAGQTGAEHEAFSRGNEQGRIQHFARRTSDCADHSGRSRVSRTSGGSDAGQGSVCRWLLLPGGAAGQGPHSHANFGGAFKGRPRFRHSRFSGSQRGTSPVI